MWIIARNVKNVSITTGKTQTLTGKFNFLTLLVNFPKVDCIYAFQNITLTNLNGAAEQCSNLH